MVAERVISSPYAGRIRLLKAKLGKNTSEIARQIGVPQSTLQKIETGKTVNISLDIAVALRDKLGVSLYWFIVGEGPVFEAENDQPTVSKLQAELESKNRTIQRLAEKLASKNKGVSNLGRVALLELQFLTGTPVGTPSAG